MEDKPKTSFFRFEHNSGFKVSDKEIIADMRRVAYDFGNGVLSRKLYSSHGVFSRSTPSNRFGSWNSALEAAGLKVLNQRFISDKELFKNIEKLWIHLGRQPRMRELVPPLSCYSERPYTRRFGSWKKALLAFVDYINSEDAESECSDQSLGVLDDKTQPKKIVKRTSREISDRLRFRVLMKDGFTCTSCGRSPIKSRDVELHVDHITPWSKGGETVVDNLATKCSKCNLGKGNIVELPKKNRKKS